jgi:predicted enzyme related to lactoylglutathione lyase
MSIRVTGIPFVAYPASDLERSKDFYERILGLKCTMDHPLHEEGKRWIEFDVGSCAIAISNIMPTSSDSGVGAALEVEDLDAALDSLRAEKVTIKTEVMESPGCRFFIIADPDGNDITIHRHK